MQNNNYYIALRNGGMQSVLIFVMKIDNMWTFEKCIAMFIDLLSKKSKPPPTKITLTRN